MARPVGVGRPNDDDSTTLCMIISTSQMLLAYICCNIYGHSYLFIGNHSIFGHNNKYMDQQWPFLGQIYVFFSTFFDVTRSNITITYYVR